MINWPTVIFLTLISLPGIFIAIPRVISTLLVQVDKSMVMRVAMLVKLQSLIMVFVMAISGSAISTKTGLNAPVFDALLAGKPIGHLILQHLFAVFVIAVITSAVFFLFYYRIFAPRLQTSTLNAMKLLRKCLRLDGAVLYGGIVEEVVARWGFMNLIAYFAALFAGGLSDNTMYLSMILSALFFSLGHIPTYFAAGCEKTRFFAFSLLCLHIIPSIAFGYVFWQFGLMAAMIAHMIFHIIWWNYDR